MAIDYFDTLSDEQIATLSDRLDCVGELRTAESLKVSRASLLRAMAKRPVRAGTLALIRIGLAKAV